MWLKFLFKLIVITEFRLYNIQLQNKKSFFYHREEFCPFKANKVVWSQHINQTSSRHESPPESTFPPIRGRMCILPVWACFTDDTMRQVPLSVTWRFDQRFTGSASFPFLTLNTPESCTRSEPPTLRGLPGKRERTLIHETECDRYTNWFYC